jgi:hypothetical protein
MKGLFLALLIALLLFSCAGFPSGPEPLSHNAPVFTGVADGFYLWKNRAIAQALKDAARRVSLYHSVGAYIQFDETYDPASYQGSRIFSQMKIFYDEDYEKYISDLEYDQKDVYEEYNAVFVRARYKGIDVKVPYSGAEHQSKPQWIENPPPTIEGFPAAVGFAGGQLSYRKTIIASYEDAIFALLQNNGHIITGVQETSGGVFSDSSALRASGIIKGFYIVETWTDPRTKAVWTLAVAREITDFTGGAR